MARKHEMSEESARIVESDFLDYIGQELGLCGAQSVGIIYASIGFEDGSHARAAGAAEPLGEVAVADIVCRLRKDVPECRWVDVCDAQIRLAARGSVVELIGYAERALRCLERTRQMVGTVPFTAQVALAVSASAEQPVELLRRARELIGGAIR